MINVLTLFSEDIAKIMNENFVSVKVDREERPDIDRQYLGPNGNFN